MNIQTALSALASGAAAQMASDLIMPLVDAGATPAQLRKLARDLDPSIPVEVTKGETTLANGAEKEVNCKRSLQQKAGKTAPAKAEKPASAKAPARIAPAKKAGKATARIVLKANKEVRSQLTAACQKLGGQRLQPVGFASYTEFLGGFALTAEGSATIELLPVKGGETVKGRVILTVDGGSKIKVATAAK